MVSLIAHMSQEKETKQSINKLLLIIRIMYWEKFILTIIINDLCKEFILMKVVFHMIYVKHFIINSQLQIRI